MRSDNFRKAPARILYSAQETVILRSACFPSSAIMPINLTQEKTAATQMTCSGCGCFVALISGIFSSAYRYQSRTIMTRHFFIKEEFSSEALICCASALLMIKSAFPVPLVFSALTVTGLFVTLWLLCAAVRSRA